MNLSRRALLAGMAAGAALPSLARAETFAGTYRPVADNVADGVWLVRGADAEIAFANGGAIANAALIATDAGAVLVDPGPSLAYGRALAALARTVAGQVVARVYITHLHPDHAMGAAAFDPAIVHALPATRAEIERDGSGFSDAMYRMLADWMAGTQVVLPQGDATDGEIVFGGRRLRLFGFDGHSHGDLALLDEATGAVIAGDLVFHDRAPATPHADIGKWLVALDRLAAIPHTVLLPGHGPLDREGTAIAQTRDWLSWLQTALRDAVASGMDMAEAGAMPIPERFARIKVARYELQRSVSHFYPALEAELLPRI